MSNAKLVNPYRAKTSYRAIFSAFCSAGKSGLTKASLLKRFAKADVGVIISPKKEGESRGDCRGNFSAQGHLYYRATHKDKKGETRYTLHMREKALPVHKRGTAKVDAKKVTTKATTKTKAKAKSKAKAKA